MRFSRATWRRVRRDAALALVAVANRLPRWASRTSGRGAGLLVWLASRGERRRAEWRVRTALGWDATQSRITVRRCAVVMGGYLADAVRLECCDKAALRRMIRLAGVEHLQSALAGGRGAFVLSAHLGNWEVLAAAIGASGVPFSVIARRPDDPVLAGRLERLRARWGVECLWRDAGARPILRALDNGRAVGVLIDQSTGVGATVPFFGWPAHTPTGPAEIALRRDVVVVPVRCVEHGRAYVGRFEPARRCSGDALSVTAEWTGIVERWVREAPHTWVWMHDRWRAVPQPARAARRGVVVPS